MPAANKTRIEHDLLGDRVVLATPYPEVKRPLFFPMAVDLADDEREERPR